MIGCQGRSLGHRRERQRLVQHAGAAALGVRPGVHASSAVGGATLTGPAAWLQANHVVSSGAGGGGKGPAAVDKRNQELPCPHCDRVFKQVILWRP